MRTIGIIGGSGLYEIDGRVVDTKARRLRTIDGREIPADTPIHDMWIRLVVDESLPAQTLLDALHDAKPAHVTELSLFDVYRGRGLTDGRKSLAILVLMQDTSRTLTDADIDATESHLLAVARDRFGATLRQ